MALYILKLTIVQRPPATLSFLRLRDSKRCQIRRLKCLRIDIASLSNQIQLILPSKASNFLGWKILKFLFQCSMFGFQMSQQCQVFHTQQLVLSECATHCAFKSVIVKPYVICHFLHVFFLWCNLPSSLAKLLSVPFTLWLWSSEEYGKLVDLFYLCDWPAGYKLLMFTWWQYLRLESKIKKTPQCHCSLKLHSAG